MTSGNDTSYIFKVNTTRGLELAVWPVQHEIGRFERLDGLWTVCAVSFWTFRACEIDCPDRREPWTQSPELGFRAHIPQRQSQSSQHRAMFLLAQSECYGAQCAWCPASARHVLRAYKVFFWVFLGAGNVRKEAFCDQKISFQISWCFSTYAGRYSINAETKATNFTEIIRLY